VPLRATSCPLKPRRGRCVHGCLCADQRVYPLPRGRRALPMLSGHRRQWTHGDCRTAIRGGLGQDELCGGCRTRNLTLSARPCQMLCSILCLSRDGAPTVCDGVAARRGADHGLADSLPPDWLSLLDPRDLVVAGLSMAAVGGSSSCPGMRVAGGLSWVSGREPSACCACVPGGSCASRDQAWRHWLIKCHASNVSVVKAFRAVARASKLAGPDDSLVALTICTSSSRSVNTSCNVAL
jgi:hypothetical protein